MVERVAFCYYIVIKHRVFSSAVPCVPVEKELSTYMDVYLQGLNKCLEAPHKELSSLTSETT